jgi:hypothetical protein
MNRFDEITFPPNDSPSKYDPITWLRKLGLDIPVATPILSVRRCPDGKTKKFVAG